jgi:prepilin peptidase CpaA
VYGGPVVLIRGTDYAWANLALTGVGALFDWRTRRIPNVLTLGVIPVAVGVHAWAAAQGRAWESVGFCFLGAAVCSLGPALLWRAGWVGGGDVKLLAAMGAVGGPTLGVESAFFAFFCAMAFVVVRLSWRGTLFRTLGSSLSLATSPLVSRVSRVSRRSSKGLAPLAPLDRGRLAAREDTREQAMDAMRFGPFALAGSAITVLFHGGIL